MVIIDGQSDQELLRGPQMHAVVTSHTVFSFLLMLLLSQVLGHGEY